MIPKYNKKQKNIKIWIQQEIKDVVITIPAYFNNTQRYETIEAAKIAGLNVIQIINENTAAAIAYGLQQHLQNKNKKNICVFDFGGGTFEVTILEINNNKFNIKDIGRWFSFMVELI